MTTEAQQAIDRTFLEEMVARLGATYVRDLIDLIEEDEMREDDGLIIQAACGCWLGEAQGDHPPCLECDQCETHCECQCEIHHQPLHAMDGCEVCLGIAEPDCWERG